MVKEQKKPMTDFLELKNLKTKIEQGEQKKNNEAKNTAEDKEKFIDNEVEANLKQVKDVQANANKDGRSVEENKDIQQTLIDFEKIRKLIRDKIEAGETVNKKESQKYNSLSRKIDVLKIDKERELSYDKKQKSNLDEAKTVSAADYKDVSEKAINNILSNITKKEQELAETYASALHNVKTFENGDDDNGELAAALQWADESKRALDTHRKAHDSKKISNTPDAQNLSNINVNIDAENVDIETSNPIERKEYNRKKDIYEKRVKRWGELFEQANLSGNKEEKEKAEKILREALDTLNNHRAQEKFVVENIDDKKSDFDKGKNQDNKKDKAIQKNIDKEKFESKLSGLEKDLVIAENMLAEAEAGNNPDQRKKAQDHYNNVKLTLEKHRNNAKFVKGYDDMGQPIHAETVEQSDLEKQRAALTGPLAAEAEKLGLTINVVDKNLEKDQQTDSVIDPKMQTAIDAAWAATAAQTRTPEQLAALKKLPAPLELKSILEKRRANHQAKIDELEQKSNLTDAEMDQLILKKEAVEILEKRISKNSDAVFEIENKNAGRLEKMGNRFKHSWGKFKTWYGKPENKKELHKRIKWTIGAMGAVGLASTGVGAVIGAGYFSTSALAASLAAKSGLGIIGAGAARFAGGYAGGEIFRRTYEGNKKDYRQVMADMRENKHGKLDSAEFIKNKNKWRTRFDRLGRMAGAFSVKGGEMLFNAIGAEDVAETAGRAAGESAQEAVEHIPTGISKDIFIHKGEGITHALARQLNASPELRSALGVQGDHATGSELARIAKQFGYINDDGSDVRVFMGEGAGYELELNNDGVVSVIEHKAGHIEGDFYVGGHESDIQGHHVSGQNFEGSNIEKQYEYLGNGNNHASASLENSGTYTTETSVFGADDDFNTTPGLEMNNNSAARYLFQENIRQYPSPGVFQSTEGLLAGEFHNQPEDIYLKNLFQENGIQFNSETLKQAGFRYIDSSPGEGTFYHEAAGRNFTQREIYESINMDSLKEKLGLIQKPTILTESGVFGADNNFGLTPDSGNAVQESGVFSTDNNFGLTPDSENIPAGSSPISVVENADGSMNVSLNQAYEFLGNNKPEAISEFDIANMESGNYSTGLNISGELGPFKDIEILKMENGSFILKQDFPEFDGFDNLYSDQASPEEQTALFMKRLGLHTSGFSSPADSNDVYTRITADQAKHIMNIYQEIKKVSQ